MELLQRLELSGNAVKELPIFNRKSCLFPGFSFRFLQISYIFPTAFVSCEILRLLCKPMSKIRWFSRAQADKITTFILVFLFRMYWRSNKSAPCNPKGNSPVWFRNQFFFFVWPYLKLIDLQDEILNDLNCAELQYKVHPDQEDDDQINLTEQMRKRKLLLENILNSAAHSQFVLDLKIVVIFL